jgi:hypothetical protein
MCHAVQEDSPGFYYLLPLVLGGSFLKINNFDIIIIRQAPRN